MSEVGEEELDYMSGVGEILNWLSRVPSETELTRVLCSNGPDEQQHQAEDEAYWAGGLRGA